MALRRPSLFLLFFDAMSEPEYLVCLNCDTPTYVFEWENGKLTSALCQTCGNDNLDEFMSDVEYDEQSGG